MENLITKLSDYINESKSTIKWYHGSDFEFDSFKNYKSSGPSALGIFVTSDINLAELFGIIFIQ